MAGWLDKVSGPLGRFQAGWGDRLQGDVVLPTARTLYLAGAFVAMGAAALALLAVIYFQIASLQPLPSIPNPPQASATTGPMPLDVVDARLSAPTDIRFVVEPSPISGLLTDHTALGHFEAATPNGLAAPPEDFQVIGGRDMALFIQDTGEYASTEGLRRVSVLRAAPALVDQINALLPTLTANRSRTFQLRVIATDALQNISAPQDLTFVIAYGPAPAAAPAAAPGPEVSTADGGALGRLAKEIALIVDPQRTDVYFDAFDRAYAMPATCGAEGQKDLFVADYRRAFDHTRTRLRSSNIDTFYLGVCDAWRSAAQARDRAQTQAQAQWARAAAEAQAERAIGLGKKLIAKTLRNAALLFMGGALLAFMTIALFLAFLAMEGHSKALRGVAEALARDSLASRRAAE